MSGTSVIDNLIDIVGQDDVLTESGLKGLGYDRPIAVVRPGAEEQVSEILKLAAIESLAVIPRGSGTKMQLGNNPERADIILSTQKLDRIVEHASSDLTVTSESGVTLGNLNCELAKESQFVPIDCPGMELSTIGGVISTNASGSLRLRYGTARETLIGLKIVKSDGTVFKGGSKVVKNVAGYDLPKLYVGSLGTLGVITEATFRLYPVPEYSETCVASFVSAEKCSEAVSSLLRSDLALSALDRVDHNLMKLAAENSGLDMKEGNSCLAVRIMNVEKAVKSQIAEVSSVCGSNGGSCSVVNENEETALWDTFREFTRQSETESAAVCKAGVLIEDVGRVFREVEHISKIHPVKTYVSAKAGNGIVNLLFEGESGPLGQAVKYLRDFCVSAGGYTVVEKAPASLRKSIDLWGDMGSGRGLMKRIKAGFDPGNILNPGRFV